MRERNSAIQFHKYSDNVSVQFGQATLATSGTAASAFIDTLQFRRAALVYLASISGTGSTADAKLQESTGGTAGSTWTDVTGGAFTTLTATSTGAAVTSVQVMNIDLAKRNRYLRVLYTGAGSTNTGFVTTAFHLAQTETAQIGVPEPTTVVTV